MQEFEIKKNIWTEADFEEMGWHDSQIRGIQWGEDFLFDIDYIVKWNEPEKPGLSFTFWIVPATSCFPSVRNLRLTQVARDSGAVLLNEILDLKQMPSQDGFTWLFETECGTVQFESPGFTQVIKARPTFQYYQFIPEDERGGLNFSMIPFSGERLELSAEIRARKQSQAQHRELKYNLQQSEKLLEELNSDRNDSKIDFKTFVERRDILVASISRFRSEMDQTLAEKSFFP